MYSEYHGLQEDRKVKNGSNKTIDELDRLTRTSIKDDHDDAELVDDDSQQGLPRREW
jgi:hypothetical protein